MPLPWWGTSARAPRAARLKSDDALLPAPASVVAAAVRNAWEYLSNVSLRADGFVGFCQPGGSSPENNYNRSTTSAFCVGDFLLAASQVARLEGTPSGATWPLAGWRYIGRAHLRDETT